MSLLRVSIALLLISAVAAAQPRGGGMPGGGAGPQGSIVGMVVDSATGEAMRVATVAIFAQTDSTLATGALTEANGHFSISGLRAGRYYARVSFLGYAPRIIDDIVITQSASRVDIGRIELAESTLQGQEVSVTARRELMTVEIDRTVYKASELPVAAGGNATDVLRNIPSLEVDIDGNVSMRGNQNVVVLLNGRALTMSGDALTSFLQNLPANSIDRIEVIPNPSAKYDPEGMSGIINIVLKEQAGRGLSGGVNGGVGTQDSYSAGVNLSYGTGPWSVSGNYGFNASGRTFTGTRAQQYHVESLASDLTQNSTEAHSWGGHMVNGTVEYTFDPKSSLALNAILNFRGSESSGTTETRERDNGELVNRYDRSSDGEDAGTGMDYRLSYRWVAEASKHELTTEARFAVNTDREDNTYTQTERNFDETPIDRPGLQRVSEDDDNRNLALQVDYVRPIAESGKLETGYKGELEQISADLFSERYDYASSEFRPDVAVNNAYDYDRQIHAFYGIYAHDFGMLGVQLGARIEQVLATFESKTTGSRFDNDYLSVFPSAFVSYRPSDAVNVKASYSRRISRPPIDWLNPFVSQDDPTFREIGNPHLKPEYIDAIELSVNHFTDLTSLTITPYFRRSTDVIRRYGDLDTSTGVGTLTFLNFDESRSYGADLVASLKLGERYSMFAGGSIYQMTTDAGNVEEGLASDAFGWNARVNATIGLLEGTDMQVTWFYRSPWQLEGGGEVGAFQGTDVALTQKLFDNALRIGIRVSDVFDQRGFRVTRNVDEYDFSYRRKPSSRVAMLTVSYTFGTPERSARRRPQGQPSVPDMDSGGW